MLIETESNRINSIIKSGFYFRLWIFMFMAQVVASLHITVNLTSFKVNNVSAKRRRCVVDVSIKGRWPLWRLHKQSVINGEVDDFGLREERQKES